MATPQDLLEAQVRLAAGQLGVLRDIQKSLADVTRKMKPGAGGGLPSPKGGGDGALSSLGGFVGTLSKGFAKVGVVVGAVSAALGAIPAAVLGVVSASKKFVAALNPSAVEQYERAQNDLRATIGYGLTPIIAYATRSLKDWAGVLLPSIQRLRPLIDRVSAGVANVSMSVARGTAALLDVVAGWMERTGDVLDRNLATIAGALEALTALGKVLDAAGLSFGNAESVVKLFADTLRRTTTGLVILTARVMQLAGATESLKRFRKSLEDAVTARRSPASGLTAAPTDATTGGYEDILRRLNERAFVATVGGAAKKSDTEYLEELVGVVADIEVNPWDWKDVIKAAINETPLVPSKEGREIISAVDSASGYIPGASAALGVLSPLLARR